MCREASKLSRSLGLDFFVPLVDLAPSINLKNLILTPRKLFRGKVYSFCVKKVDFLERNFAEGLES